ncbi:MAG: 3-isopropylmalate dehydratase large subunit [Syntrophales bacterium]
MGLTISEKILLDKSKRRKIQAGEIITVKVDLIMGNDPGLPIVISEFKKIGKKEVFDRGKVFLILDHLVPCRDVLTADNNRVIKEFAREYRIKNYFEMGRAGIEHVFLSENGDVKPGQLLIAGDSHTCTHGALGALALGMGSTDLAYSLAFGETWVKVPETMKFSLRGKLPRWIGGKDLILNIIGRIGIEGASYRVMEFGGEVIHALGMSDRFTMCNMAVEAGAKTAIIEPDEVTLKFMSAFPNGQGKVFHSDADAAYAEIHEIDVSKLRPQVACPYSPDNVKPVDEVCGIPVDQVVIGSCTNGRLEDLKIAAELLKGKTIHPDVRLIIIPGSQKVYLESIQQGFIETFIKAGAVVTNPTCGPCGGGHMGVLGEGERAVTTTNRNFVGRMGHRKSEVYLANPAVAAASALKGRIACPEEAF